MNEIGMIKITIRGCLTELNSIDDVKKTITAKSPRS